MGLLEELAQLFAATDNFYLSRDLLFRVQSLHTLLLITE